jgi:hypothetical protein
VTSVTSAANRRQFRRILVVIAAGLPPNREEAAEPQGHEPVPNVAREETHHLVHGRQSERHQSARA